MVGLRQPILRKPKRVFSLHLRIGEILKKPHSPNYTENKLLAIGNQELIWNLMYSQYGSWQPWLEARKAELINTWGLDADFADKVAVLLAYLMDYGLNPRISRGWSDPAHQKALQARWDSGDRAGLRVRPATTSKHTTTGFLNSRAASAIDVPCSDDSRAAKIAAALGIGAGITFHDSDPGHFFKI